MRHFSSQISGYRGYRELHYILLYIINSACIICVRVYFILLYTNHKYHFIDKRIGLNRIRYHMFSTTELQNEHLITKGTCTSHINYTNNNLKI